MRTPVVLALRALGLGDALTGVPALRGVRRRWPAARLVLAAPAGVGGWLRDGGLVDDVLPVSGIAPLAAGALVRAAAEHPGVLGGDGTGGVDVAVNLHGRGPQSTDALAALHPRELLAFDSPGGPAWDPGEHEVLRWCRLVAAAGGDCGPADLVLRDTPTRSGTVVVHPGAASGSRRWPADRWADVVADLAGRGLDVAVTGGPDERELCAQVAAAGARDTSGALSLAELADLVGSAGLLLCGDTGVAHLATACRTPSVLLFGPTPPEQWGPAVDADRHVVLWPAPAGHRGDPHGARPDPALLATSVEDVLAAADGLLQRSTGWVGEDDRTFCPQDR